MPIHRLIQNLSFNQDDIDRLSAAYEDALRALHISDRDDPVNQIVAQRIIEGARAGVRDPRELCSDGNKGPNGSVGPASELDLANRGGLLVSNSRTSCEFSPPFRPHYLGTFCRFLPLALVRGAKQRLRP